MEKSSFLVTGFYWMSTARKHSALMGVMGVLMGLWDSIYVFGKILMVTKLYHPQNVFYKVRWNYYKLQQLSLLITTMDSSYKFRQLFYYT